MNTAQNKRATRLASVECCCARASELLDMDVDYYIYPLRALTRMCPGTYTTAFSWQMVWQRWLWLAVWHSGDGWRRCREMSILSVTKSETNGVALSWHFTCKSPLILIFTLIVVIVGVVVVVSYQM